MDLIMYVTMFRCILYINLMLLDIINCIDYIGGII